MALIEIDRDPPPRTLRQFACLVCPAAAVLGALLIVRRTGSVAGAGVVLAAGAAMVLVGLLRPRWVRPIFVGALLATAPIGWVVSHLILAVIYYLVITPLGGLMRLVGRDRMGRRLDRAAETYWVRRLPAPDKGRYFRQF